MAIGVARGFDTWAFQESYVERIMDNAAYTAAHPDDSLVLAGPARKSAVVDGGASLLAIGMLQAAQFSQTKPTQPMMAIGSGRSFYVSGKAQTQWSFGRLFVNGRNLLRVLNHNAMASGLDPSQFDDPATLGKGSNQQYFINLDSEMYLVPFGLGAVFRDKSHGYCGGFFAELCMITSYAMGWNAGQNLILENVTGLSDRLLPFGAAAVKPGQALNNPDHNATALPGQLNAILGFVDNQTDVTTEPGGSVATTIVG